MSHIHSLTLRNDRSEVARMTTWLDGLVAPLDVSAKTVHALQLCLTEAVTNVITHAFEPATKHDVQVAVWRDAATLHAEVTDDGRAFDPLAHDPPAAPRDLASAPVGGLGIKLMRSFAGTIAYRRSASTNRLLLSFPAASAAADAGGERGGPDVAPGHSAVQSPAPPLAPIEIGGPKGPEPTRYGDWEVNGRCTDF